MGITGGSVVFLVILRRHDEAQFVTHNWQEMSTLEQRKLLNSACRDLSEQLRWHGNRLSLDDWRHLLSGTILGWRMMPAIDKGEGQAAGFIMLGGSSLDLNKKQCTDAIELAFLLGDHPEGQGLNNPPVRWGKVVCGARWLTD